MSASPPPKPGPNLLPPLAPAVRQRVQMVFERARQCMERNERDYAHDLLSQCVADDPGNLIYLQHLVGNLAQKYGNNKRGAKLAGLKIKSSRNALIKASGRGEWREAFQAACDALRYNPWDTPTLVAIADACEQIGSHETEIFVMRWALDVDTKDPLVNRRAAAAFARMGQFDAAIGCWRRVEQSKPGDQEASKAIAQLSVEQTIQKAGYNEELLRTDANVPDMEMAVRASMNRGRKEVSEAPKSNAADAVREQALMDAMQSQPAEVSNYLELAKIFAAHDRLPDAERVLTQALAVTGGGDLTVRERLEDIQLQRVQQQLLVANRRAEQEQTEEATELAKRMAAQSNQIEMETYAARSARDPGNLLLKYELGLRMKRAGKFREAIQAFQGARDDVRHRAEVQLQLGECFQHIRQFKLALTSYEAALEAAESMQPEVQKLALYRAGVLAAEFKDVDRAEKYLTELAAIDFGYRDVADRLDKLAALRDSV